MASESNLYIAAGVDYEIKVLVASPDDDTFDVGDYTFYCKAAKVWSSTISFEGEVEADANVQNGIVVTFEAYETEGLKPGKYQYDVTMVNDLTGKRDQVLTGLIFIEQSISSSCT